MKIFIPRHIEWGLFNMNVQIWPLNITMVQLFILAWWLWLTLAVWNSLVKNWVDKIVSMILVSPIFIIFCIIAFFKFSELKLVPFLAKMVRTYFFDETKKFQVNFKRIDPLEVKIKRMKSNEPEQIIEVKKSTMEKEKLDKLKTFL